MATILLVEDIHDRAAAIRRELEACGYEVLRAADSESALALHAAYRPSLVVLDWALPGLDGPELLDRLREAAPAPVLAFAAPGGETGPAPGPESDYLAGPFSVGALLARVQAILHRAEFSAPARAESRPAGDGVVTWGAITLDPITHRAALDGAPLDLSPTEFNLLHLLLRDPGCAFSREDLLDTVWGAGYISGDRAVDNAVMRLRKKLGAAGEAIETVWGVGYRLRGEA
ncbi:MAG: response regulator transcription factor [Anaerolineae bacterium]|nr:response regulator transcription factor [Anaerolineae bacterium]